MPLLLFRAKNVLFVFLFGGVSAVLSFFFFLFFCFFFFANSTPAGQKLFNLPHRTGGLDVAEPTVVSADATSKRMRINGIVLSIQTSLSSFPLFPPFSSATALFFAKDCGRWCRISRAREISRKNNGKRLRGRKREPERRIRHEDDCGFSRVGNPVLAHTRSPSSFAASTRNRSFAESNARRNGLSGTGRKQGKAIIL